MWMTAKERMEHIYEEDCIASVPSDEGIAALLADRAAVLERLREEGLIRNLVKTDATISEILERTNETR